MAVAVNDQDYQKSGIPNGTGRDRLIQLAQPKEDKLLWITSCGSDDQPLGSYDDQRWNIYRGFDKSPRVTWGTQETLWPVSRAAKEATASERVNALSTPKRNFQMGDNKHRAEFMYSCGRSSVIWSVSPMALEGQASDRVQLLAGHKQTANGFQEDRPHYVFSCGRSSPIWKVSRWARHCAGRDRTEHLATAKPVHPHYVDNRGVQTEIPPTALTATPSGRTETLAVAKNRPDGPFRDSAWPVSMEAKKASPSGRSIELSKPKSVPDGYLAARAVIWPVPRAARKAQPTTRMEELSQPIVRASMDHVQFDPNAFMVKESSLKARCSRRVEELAQPIQR